MERLEKIAAIMDYFRSLSDAKKIEFKEEFYGSKFDQLYDASDDFINALFYKINGKGESNPQRI